MTRIYGYCFLVKTTIDLPDELFRKAKASAALRGVSLRHLVTESLREKLEVAKGKSDAEPPWMRGFGALSELSEETRRIEALIDREFEEIEEA